MPTEHENGGWANDDQKDYMRSLARIPRNERCKCGWYRLGECSHPECRDEYHPADLPHVWRAQAGKADIVL